MGRYVFHHHAACAYHAVVAYGHTRQYAYIGAYPDIVADSYRTGIFKPLVPLLGVNRMAV